VIAAQRALTGRDLGRVEQLPDTGMKNEVVMQRHEIVRPQRLANVRIAGASPIEIGAAAVRISRSMITLNAAALCRLTADGAKPADRSEDVLRRLS
jgi:hypothetical protein